MLDAFPFYGIEGNDIDADIFVMGDEDAHDKDDISLAREEKAIFKDLVSSYIEHSKMLVKNSSRYPITG